MCHLPRLDVVEYSLEKTVKIILHQIETVEMNRLAGSWLARAKQAKKVEMYNSSNGVMTDTHTQKVACAGLHTHTGVSKSWVGREPPLANNNLTSEKMKTPNQTETFGIQKHCRTESLADIQPFATL